MLMKFLTSVSGAVESSFCGERQVSASESSTTKKEAQYLVNFFFLILEATYNLFRLLLNPFTTWPEELPVLSKAPE